MKILDYSIYLIIRFIFFIISSLPQPAALWILARIARLVILILPKYKRVALINLRHCFPELSDDRRAQIFRDSLDSLARLVLDFARLHKIDKRWAEEHVEIPRRSEVDAVLAAPARKGALYVTGHLGSFELLAHSANLLGYPQSFIVRNFKNPYIDRWWNSRRQSQGNIVISRVGAVKEVIRNLEEGKDVGILFDQNVTRKHAVFVDFFGTPAATTKTVGLAAVRTEAIILIVSMQHLSGDRYRINWEHRNFDALYKDQTLSTDDKALKITQEVSDIYASMIKNDPGAWFWLHRRWKTVPEGALENFYSEV